MYNFKQQIEIDANLHANDIRSSHKIKIHILDYNKNLKIFWKIQVTEIIFCNCLSGKLETSEKVEAENDVEIVELSLG